MCRKDVQAVKLGVRSMGIILIIQDHLKSFGCVANVMLIFIN